MKDPRIIKLAKLLVRYSLDIKKGNTVSISSDAVAAPLVQECYREVLKCGAFPVCDIRIGGLREIFFKEANKEQIGWVSPFAKYKVERIDKFLSIIADDNTRALSNANAQKMAEHAKAQQPLRKIYMKRTAAGDLNWALTQWPCNASAQDAEMSLEEYEEFVFTAGHLDDKDPIKTWKKISKEQQALTDFLNTASEVRIVAEDTDLTYKCKGRKWINCDGKKNFPDGEVFTGPIENSVEGYIKFSFPTIHGGREANGVRLEFEKGKVIRAEADKGKDFLMKMINMDKGSCYVGEAAIATNYNIKNFTKNTLFDEKIGGTIHIALGQAYPETGSKNTSGLHWDMITDLRKGGEIYVDGKLIQKNGIFLNKKFPQK